MIAILTGDLIASAKKPTSYWMPVLKNTLSEFGKTPRDWEIYRGDAFQLEIKEASTALITAIHLKAMLKMNEGLDARMSIGLGEKKFTARRITQSNGSAFVNAGQRFDTLKPEKVNLAIETGNERLNQELNLIIKLALVFMDNWSPTSAKLVNICLKQPGIIQSDIAGLLNINQSAVSQQKKRAQFDLVEDLNTYFTMRIKEYAP